MQRAVFIWAKSRGKLVNLMSSEYCLAGVVRWFSEAGELGDIVKLLLVEVIRL